MTPGYMTLTLGPRKNPQRKVAFLLEKSVELLIRYLISEKLLICYEEMWIVMHFCLSNHRVRSPVNLFDLKNSQKLSLAIIQERLFYTQDIRTLIT